MRGTRRALGAVSTTAALVAGLTLTTTGAAHAQDGTALATRTFTFATMRSGDCTMLSGARWTLTSDGRAFFDGTVTSSDDDDAWLMWAKIKDENGAVLGWLRHTRSNPTNLTKFVKNLPSHTERYRWQIRPADAEFDAGLFPLVKHMSLSNHC
ncbi:DUF6294 family protein [Nonomuraea sp. NPDC050783]|uniref:DUF6294 family protein n=1 Tax=Nonomuraea sp. NPDC050783 TaxID=3154634 RepID=UPI003467E3ED